MTVPRLVVTGIGGYGRTHLENARRLQSAGRAQIAALVDPAVARDRGEVDGVPLYSGLEEGLAAHEADIVIVATPLDTHADLAELAMRSGADVLLEKPPVPTQADFERLLAVQQQTGRAIQLGFQSLGSTAIPALRTDALGIGPITAVSAAGLWSRTRAYWGRARWAGRRVLDGHPVVDGVATNALAHAVATALRLAGYDTAESVDRVEVEGFRANPIEADDTTSLRITGEGLPTVSCALTLCASPELVERADHAATVTVWGRDGSAELSYTTDVVTLGAPAAEQTREFGRVDLLENLLDHRRTDAELLVPLAATGAFMRVVEAIRLAPDPAAIDPAHIQWHGAGPEAYPVIDGIEAAVRDASAGGRLFSESGVPWAAAALAEGQPEPDPAG